VGLDLIDDILTADTRLDQFGGVVDSRIDLQPHIDLGFFTIGAGVRRRVATVAIGDRVEQDRTMFFFEKFLLAADGIDDGQRVVPVDALRVHLVGAQSGAQPSEDLKAHRFTDRLAAHAVEIVVEVHDERQPPPMVLVPQFEELVHRGEAQAFPNRATSQ